MKKMRKLIPAFAMLMVAAIMMTTASFAWFTMNDQVSATGMQVQAKASGNLLIGTQKLDASSKGITADFSEQGKSNLKPATFDNGTWKTTGTSNVVDPLYGTVTGTLSNIDSATASEYFYEQVVYLATAGTAYTAPITLTIDPTFASTNTIAYAYTVAISVGETANWAAPDITYSVAEKEGKVNGASTAIASKTTTTSYQIPSTYGTTASTAVGLKVTIRIYVDGALSAGTTTVDVPVIEEMDYSTSTKYNATAMAGWTFYTDADGKGVVDSEGFVNGVTDLEELGILYYWAGEYEDSEPIPYNYVNNSSVPNVATSFNVTFKATDPANS